MLDEQIDAIDKLTTAAERFDQFGPYAVLFLVLVTFILALLVTAIYFRYLGKDKDLDNETVKELRVISKELVNVSSAISQSMGDIKERNDDNYLALNVTLKRQYELMRRMLKRQGAETQEVKKLVKAVEGIPETFQAEMQRAMIDFVGVLATERATLFTEHNFEFPPEDDCRWQKAFMKPINGRMVQVHRIPVFHDKNVVGKVETSGEIGSVILYPTIAGWCIVRLMRIDGEQVRGWVYRNAIEVQLPGDGDKEVKEEKVDGTA